MAAVGDRSGPAGSPRSYRSPRREEQAKRTRRKVLDAARKEFLASGWAATTMRSIAAGASVSLPTVEAAFGTKAGLLKQVIDVAIAGDDEPVAVLDRAPIAQAASQQRVEDLLRLVATVLAEAQRRSARLVQVLSEAATVDPGLRELAADRLAQRSRTAEWIADQVIQRAALRPGLDRDAAVDTVWLLMEPVLFARLTDDRGWSDERYRDWFADSAQRLLLGSDALARGGAEGQTPGV